MSCPHPEKAAHRSKYGAYAERDALERTRGIDLALKPYRCGDHWHIGHSASSKPLTFSRWDQKMRRRAARKAKR